MHGWKAIFVTAIGTVMLAGSVRAQDSLKVDTEGVKARILYEADISGGHLPELTGKYKLRVTEIVIRAGGYVGAHNHEGPGIREMTEGEMEYVLPDTTIYYGAGDFFFETGDVSHHVNSARLSKHVLFEILPAKLEGPSLIRPRAHAGIDVPSGFHSRRFTTTDGAVLHYLEAGLGPLIVLVPGWTLPASSWSAQLEHLADRYHVVAMDPRAHGASSKPMDGLHVARLGADIGELIDHLDAGPAIIAGHSHGAFQAMTYLTQSGTEKAAALIIVDMSLGTEVPAEEAHPVRNGWRRWIAGLQGPDRREWTKQWAAVMLRDDYPEEDREKLVDGIMQIPTIRAVTILSNTMLHDRRDYRPVLASLDIPVFFIGSDLGWAHAAAAEITALRPDAGTINLDGTSHFLHIDHPDRFNEALDRFLATLRDGN